MHEFGIAQQIVRAAADAACAAGCGAVRSVTCRIGALRQIEQDTLELAFAAASEGGRCDGATLRIERTALRARCRDCAVEFEVRDWRWECPNCEGDGEALPGGDELELCSIEAEAGP